MWLCLSVRADKQEAGNIRQGICVRAPRNYAKGMYPKNVYTFKQCLPRYSMLNHQVVARDAACNEPMNYFTAQQTCPHL